MFIVDTNVVSELRKAATGRADPRVVAWADAVRPATLFLSVVTLMELEMGILRLARRDAPRAGALRRWFETQVLPAFDGRVLPVDAAVARHAARLHVPDPRGERDGLIAATALTHGMAVVTRNVADFGPLGVPVVDPWA